MNFSVSGLGALKRVSLIAAVLLACAAAGCSNSSTPSSPTSTTTTTAAGTTSAAQVTLAPTALSFSTQTFDTPGMTQQVILTNSGTDTLVISSVVASGNFTETDNCIGSFAPSEACTINVTFVNVGAGSGGTITITDNASTSPQTIAITGPTVSAPAAVLSTSSVTFPNQAVGTTSAAQTVTLRCPINGFSAPLAISSIVTVGDFIITGKTCGSSLSAGTSCTMTVAFAPTAAGVRTGFLTVFDNATGGAHSATLTGTGS
jgi:hypothetical protein